MKLYTYYRSSAAWRVRIALALKGLNYEPVFVHLTRNKGEQCTPAYKALNPQALVPTLEDGEVRLGQSLAIIDYLDEIHPEPPLLPDDFAARAQIRSLALSIACEIHPLNNLRVLQHITGPMALDDDTKLAWYQHWIALGFEAFEAMLPADAPGRGVCLGDVPTLADICLVPQVFNANRFSCDLAPYPKIRAVNESLLERAAFAETHPARQPDAE
jgi:maleylacetoacetate isomerase